MTSTAVPQNTRTKSQYLADLKREIAGQHEAASAKQAQRGKRGARERVLALLDGGVFVGDMRVRRIVCQE